MGILSSMDTTASPVQIISMLQMVFVGSTQVQIPIINKKYVRLILFQMQITQIAFVTGITFTHDLIIRALYVLEVRPLRTIFVQSINILESILLFFAAFTPNQIRQLVIFLVFVMIRHLFCQAMGLIANVRQRSISTQLIELACRVLLD
ncbi:Hypothetical_protein [Hexamita inflata]|uniref:Hypothetical_protein n=1 Tax=Hexamita inflata TaxID=28002 RepID=A0AA86P2I0_9EUKA|nr:Hypothetical protein HINF_LOCUS17630 [Hexamita inflata]